MSRVLASVWTHTGVGRVTTGIAPSSSSPAGSEASQGDLAGNPLLALVHTGIENDFESVAFGQHPSLREIKRALVGTETGSLEDGTGPALCAALSGSGSALFGIYGSQRAAQEAQQRVQALGTRTFLPETLPRPEYWQRIFA